MDVRVGQSRYVAVLVDVVRKGIIKVAIKHEIRPTQWENTTERCKLSEDVKGDQIDPCTGKLPLIRIIPTGRKRLRKEWLS